MDDVDTEDDDEDEDDDTEDDEDDDDDELRAVAPLDRVKPSQDERGCILITCNEKKMKTQDSLNDLDDHIPVCRTVPSPDTNFSGFMVNDKQSLRFLPDRRYIN